MLTVVVHLAKGVALARGYGVGVEDALLLHPAGAQADALTGVLLAQAPDKFKSSYVCIVVVMTRVNT